MSVESRTPILSLRRAKKESERPDYSEPDFGSWAARLDSYVSPAQAAAIAAAAQAEADAVAAAATTGIAPVVAPVIAPVVDVAPIAPPSAERSSLEDALTKLLEFDGAMSVALVDSESGMILGKAGSGVNMELAAAGASVMLRARLTSAKTLGTNEKIDDILISLTSQIQIIHPLATNPTIFTYLVGDKEKSSLAMARYKATEADLQIQL